MERKNVLIFAYYWPPASSPGVWRWMKFARYMQDYGWNPIVITVANGSYPKMDHSLEKQLPADLEVHKTKTFEPFGIYNALRGQKGKTVPVAMTGVKNKKSFFHKLSMYIRSNWFVPDPRKGWKKYAVAKAEKLIRERKIDAFITTSPPNSVHLIGIELKKRHPDLKWMMDFRDPWVKFFFNTHFLDRKPATVAKDQALEDKALSLADGLISVGPGLVSDYADRAKKLKVIYNGFDEEDFAPNESIETEYFELTWVGNLKPNQDTRALWAAIAGLCERDATFREKFRLVLVGNVDTGIRQHLSELGLDPNVEDVGFVNHGEALRYMREAGLLLFTIPYSNYSRHILTGKIFEYIGSETRILPVGPPDGDAAKVLLDTGRGQMLDYEDREGIEKKLRHEFDAWLSAGQRTQKVTEGDTSAYTRKNLTKEMVDFLNSL